MDELSIKLAEIIDKFEGKYKFAQTDEWARLVANYENGTDIVDELQNAMLSNAKKFWHESDKGEKSSKIFNLLLKQSNALNKVRSEMMNLDEEIAILI